MVRVKGRFPGNCNNLCMNIREYLKVITLSHGIVPEFVNPKYKVGLVLGNEE